MRRGDGSIEPNKLIALLHAATEAREASQEISAAVRDDLKVAALEHGLHTRAFNLCLSIARLDQVKRIALLNAFDSYRHILGLDDEPQHELLPDPPTQLRDGPHG